MRVLITGGAGFIGSHLAEHLLEQKHAVRVVDDLSTGRRRNLEAVSGHPDFEFREASVLDGRAMAEAVRGCEAIFHLAASVGVLRILETPIDTIERNVLGTGAVLRAAAEAKIPVLLASTSEVYGNSGKVPFREDDDTQLGPARGARWSYACSKLTCEHLALAYASEKGLPVVIARIFNTVGPRQTGRYGMVLPRFVRQAIEGGPLTVFGTGEQTRSFAHVRDVVAGLARLLFEPAAAGRIFNIGSDAEISINELAERVRARVNPQAGIRRIPYEEAYGPGFDDLPRRVPDLARIRATIGYRTERTLEQAIDELAAEEHGRAGIAAGRQA